MVKEDTLAHYMAVLLEGDRLAVRRVVEETLQTGVPANAVYMDLIWPIMIEIEQLYKDSRISAAQEHMATRINRTIVDQLQNKLPRKATRDKKVAICSGPGESSELGAQMTADLFESDGWEVRFLGAGLCNEDILMFVHEYRPDILLIYGTVAQEAPSIRQLVDRIRDVNAFPEMKIMISGGLFNQAEGLWEEIGAELFASTAGEAVKVAENADQMLPTEPNRTINRRKRRRQQRINAALN